MGLATEETLLTLQTSLTVKSNAFSSALEASHVVKASAGNLYSTAARLDSTAPSGTYYVQILNAASLPANGAVTHLTAPKKIQHTTGVDDEFYYEFDPGGIAASTGIVVVLSTTEFTKTISGAYLSLLGASYS
jgi:hypothetical protein